MHRRWLTKTQVYTEKGVLKRQIQEVESKTWHTRRGDIKQEIAKLKLRTGPAMSFLLQSVSWDRCVKCVSEVNSHKWAHKPIRLVCEDAFTAFMLADSADTPYRPYGGPDVALCEHNILHKRLQQTWQAAQQRFGRHNDRYAPLRVSS